MKLNLRMGIGGREVGRWELEVGSWMMGFNFESNCDITKKR